MNFFEYLDIQYVNKNISNQTNFSIKNEAGQKAAANLIRWQRNYFKFWAHFGLVIGFFKAKFTHDYPVKMTMPLQQPAKANEHKLKAVPLDDVKPE